MCVRGQEWVGECQRETFRKRVIGREERERKRERERDRETAV